VKIAILGTRGIPNAYGGIEEFAEHLSVELAKQGHEITVYQSSDHPFKEKIFKGVRLSPHHNPEKYLGPAGQFVYDLMCILDSRRQSFDVILQVGYTSSSVWSWLLPSHKSFIITNMDGLEWKRSKWNTAVKAFLRQAEKWAVRSSHFLVSDSLAIRKFILETYQKDSTYIPYGTYSIEQEPSPDMLHVHGLKPFEYNLMIARLEPENNIEMIIKATIAAGDPQNKFVITGSTSTKFGQYLLKTYSNHPLIQFTGGIFNREKLSALRFFSNFYFHGHCVGGTNPSLLEAMGGYCLIYAHENDFNKLILGQDGGYFSTENDLVKLIKTAPRKRMDHPFLGNNLKKTKYLYSWENVAQAYEQLFKELLNGETPKPNHFTPH
jgi:glycosyltransferase involved in cell wall biosynthesis